MWIGAVGVVAACTAGLQETFTKFSEERLPYVGNEPSDVWRAYIPSHASVSANGGETFTEAVRTIAVVYGFDVSTKATNGIYTGEHADRNLFTRTIGGANVYFGNVVIIN